MLFLLFSRRFASRVVATRTVAPTHRAEASAASVRAARCASSESSPGDAPGDVSSRLAVFASETASASASRRSASRLNKSARARSSAAAARREMEASSSTSAKAAVAPERTSVVRVVDARTAAVSAIAVSAIAD